MEGMLQFSRVKGSEHAQCPDLQAPPAATVFQHVSSGFLCDQGMKQVTVYNEDIKSEVIVCGEFKPLVWVGAQFFQTESAKMVGLYL